MNEPKKMKILQWSVALLLLCNIGLIITIWFRPPMARAKHETPRDFVIRNLKFSDSQVRQYDVLIRDHQQAMRSLRQQAREYRQQLFKGLESDNPQVVNTDSLAALIGKAQAQIETVTYEHFAEVRKICTDAQKPEFDKIISDVIKKMNGGPHGGPPGREGERHGPPPGEERPPVD
jgi:hypothetical protein